MTDVEWASSTDPDVMLVFLNGIADDRRLRLWCCACVRRIWDQLASADAGRRAVSVAEEFADGRASSEELERAFQDAQEVISTAPDIRAKNALRAAAWCASRAVDALGVARSVGWGATHAAIVPEQTERSAQAGLLRDVFGNPLR